MTKYNKSAFGIDVSIGEYLGYGFKHLALSLRNITRLFLLVKHKISFPALNKVNFKECILGARDYYIWLRFPHEVMGKGRTGEVYRVMPDNGMPTFYLKVYIYPKWRDVRRVLLRGGFFGKSRARIEYENLCHLYEKRLAPPVLLFLEKRFCFFLRYSYFLIEEVSKGETLDLFIFREISHLSLLERKNFLKSLAETTRKMNEGSFINGEYHWRNILVRREGDSFVFKIIDPSKRRLRDRILHPYMDLACLDVYAENFFSKEERLYFLDIYLGDSVSPSKKRKIIQNIAKLRKKVSQKELKIYHRAYQNFQKQDI